MNFGNILKELRNNCGLTQLQLANILDISKSNISKYEAGSVEPNMDTLIRIANYFNVSVDYILGNDKYNIDYANYQMDTFEFGGNFKDRLRKILEEKGIHESDLARITGFHTDDVNAYIWGNKIPSIEDLIKLSGSLHVSTDYLLGMTDEEPISDEDRSFLKDLTERERNIIGVYRQLNEDNQDIIVGEMKKYLKEQRYENSVAAEEPMRRAVGK